MTLLAAYVGWAAVGKRVTGHGPYFFLDPDVVGSSGQVALYSTGLVALGPLGMQSSQVLLANGNQSANSE